MTHFELFLHTFYNCVQFSFWGSAYSTYRYHVICFWKAEDLTNLYNIIDSLLVQPGGRTTPSKMLQNRRICDFGEAISRVAKVCEPICQMEVKEQHLYFTALFAVCSALFRVLRKSQSKMTSFVSRPGRPARRRGGSRQWDEVARPLGVLSESGRRYKSNGTCFEPFRAIL